MNKSILDHDNVIECIKNCKNELRMNNWNGKKISGVYSSKNHGKPEENKDKDENGYTLQYVDLVMEGGGVLGFALVGYTYLLEEMGIRFVGLGGTSAGAINAILLASQGPFNEKKSEKILEILSKKESNFFSFIDTKQPLKYVIQNVIKWNKDLNSKIKVILSIILPLLILVSGFLLLVLFINKELFIISGSICFGFFITAVIFFITVFILFFFIWNFKGINPGDNFRNWLQKNIGKNNFSEIEDCMKGGGSKLYNENNKELEYSINKKLAIISSEITTETKVRFPVMRSLFFNENDKNIKPADFVRMSMSIPFFFKSVKVKSLPYLNDDLKQKWRNWAGIGRNENPQFPTSAEFVDGGTMSNFPIDSFHRYNKFIMEYDDNGNKLPDKILERNKSSINDNCPNMPTLGVKIGTDRQCQNKIESISDFLMQIFNSSRHLHDYEFILNNPDYENLVEFIDTKSTKINWLDFDLSEDDKAILFIKGLEAATKFLIKFDWGKYKERRKKFDKNFV